MRRHTLSAATNIEVRGLILASFAYLSGGGVGEGAGSYGSSTNSQDSIGGNRFFRLRQDTSYTSKEKKLALDFWEKSILTKMPSAAEKSNYRHYSKLEEQERYEEQQRENERVQKRNEYLRKTFTDDPSFLEKPHVKRNLKPNIEELYAGAATPSTRSHQQTADEELRHRIVELLVKAERRIKFAADYGSFRIMALLNDGETLLSEGEELLRVNKWMTPEMQSRIDEMRRYAEDVKFNHDID